MTKLVQNDSSVVFGGCCTVGNPTQVHCVLLGGYAKVITPNVGIRTQVLDEINSDVSVSVDPFECDIGVLHPLGDSVVDFGLLPSLSTHEGIRNHLRKTHLADNQRGKRGVFTVPMSHRLVSFAKTACSAPTGDCVTGGGSSLWAKSAQFFWNHAGLGPTTSLSSNSSSIEPVICLTLQRANCWRMVSNDVVCIIRARVRPRTPMTSMARSRLQPDTEFGLKDA